MTQEDKELLLRDLCARLPYNLICFKEITNCMPGDSVLSEKEIYSFRTGKPTVADYGQHDYYKTVVLELKPYLRPMSSMTEEEKRELSYKSTDLCFDAAINAEQGYNVKTCSYDVFIIDWLTSHYFDYRGLIEKGLALEAPEGMYNIKEK